MYNREILNKWNMTEDECEKEARSITVSGYRLTYDEKMELLFLFKENFINRDDIEAVKEHIDFSRKLEEKVKEDEKLVREFVKEWRRLERKYDYFELEDKTLDELVEMWCNDYFELYFMEDKFDLIEYYGAKQYAQLYCYNVGVCPASEVSMWN